MKTEKFEDIVKQKLESIAPEFQESDWGAFQKYSSQHTGTLENIFLKSKIFKTAAVLLIGSVMALAVNMYFENKVLKEDIAKIKEELAQNRVQIVERQVSENQGNNNINSTAENQANTTAYGNTNTPNTIKSKDLNSRTNAINQGQQSTNQGVQNTGGGPKGNAENDNSIETEPAKKNIFAKKTKKTGYFDTQNEVPNPVISKTRGRRNATRKAAAQSMNDEFVVNNYEKSSSRNGANMSSPGQSVQSTGENAFAITSENITYCRAGS